MDTTKKARAGETENDMKLPNAEHAIVSEAKISDYLLSLTHPRGRKKAVFFRRHGFTQETLSVALLDHATACDIARMEKTPFGMKYIVEGPLNAPDGEVLSVRSVWITLRGEDKARLVTAYPLKGGASDDTRT